MSTGLKMAASAVVAAALTAALFLTLGSGPGWHPAPPPQVPAADAVVDPPPPLGATSEDEVTAVSGIPAVPRDLPVIQGDGEVRGRVATAAGEGVEEYLKRAGGSWWSPDDPVMAMAQGTWWLQAVQGNDRSGCRSRPKSRLRSARRSRRSF